MGNVIVDVMRSEGGKEPLELHYSCSVEEVRGGEVVHVRHSGYGSKTMTRILRALAKQLEEGGLHKNELILEE